MTFAQSPKTLDDLRRGDRIVGDKFNTDPDRLMKPIWFNEEKFQRGQQFLRDHALSVIIEYFVSLLIGFVVPPLAEAVIFTNRSTGPDKSRQRYLSTMAHIYTWHTYDIFDPMTRGYASLQMVRNYHESARFSLQAAQNRNQTTGMVQVQGLVKISQYDMALVQSGFIGPICMYPGQFGVSCKDEDMDDYRYFWRVIGYVLGLDDRFNVCGGNLYETRSLSREIEQSVVVPGLLRMEPYYVTLAEDFVEGMKVLFPAVGKDWLLAFVYPLMDLSPPRLGWMDWFRLKMLKLNFWFLRNFTAYRKYVNYFVLDSLKRLEKHIFERIDV